MKTRSLGNELRKLRIDRMMSQLDAAKAADMKQGNLCKYELDRIPISLKGADRIAAALGYRIEIRFVKDSLAPQTTTTGETK